MLATVRAAEHGGTVILILRHRASELLSDGRHLRVKYGFDDEEPRRRIATLVAAIDARDGSRREQGNAAVAKNNDTVKPIDAAMPKMSTSAVRRSRRRRAPARTATREKSRMPIGLPKRSATST
jgi:hypothetical protein